MQSQDSVKKDDEDTVCGVFVDVASSMLMSSPPISSQEASRVHSGLLEVAAVDHVSSVSDCIGISSKTERSSDAVEEGML